MAPFQFLASLRRQNENGASRRHFSIFPEKRVFLLKNGAWKLPNGAPIGFYQWIIIGNKKYEHSTFTWIKNQIQSSFSYFLRRVERATWKSLFSFIFQDFEKSWKNCIFCNFFHHFNECINRRLCLIMGPVGSKKYLQIAEDSNNLISGITCSKNDYEMQEAPFLVKK